VEKNKSLLLLFCRHSRERDRLRNTLYNHAVLSDFMVFVGHHRLTRAAVLKRQREQRESRERCKKRRI